VGFLREIKMNAVIKSDLVAGLRDLYKGDDAAHRLFDRFAGRKKDAKFTTAARAADLASASHGEIIALFRELDGIGAGEFKVGRRGSVSRMEWLYSVRSLGAAAQGVTGQPEAIDLTEIDDGEAEAENETSEDDFEKWDWITHTFQLRPTQRVTIKLPMDLTAKEAERLAGFIRQVPFSED
jgi:hypothetical protein